jgi:hypothetical protein
LSEHTLDDVVGHIEASVGDDPPYVLIEIGDRQQMELKVLNATANGLADFLGVCGREHEHNVFRRLFEGLQQGSFSATRQHVDFVENENAVTTGAGQSRRLDDISNLSDTVVAGCVELEDVVTGASLD